MAIEVTHGSFKYKFNISMYILEGYNSHQRILGFNIASNSQDFQSLLWNEVVGGYGVMFMVKTVYEE